MRICGYPWLRILQEYHLDCTLHIEPLVRSLGTYPELKPIAVWKCSIVANHITSPSDYPSRKKEDVLRIAEETE